MKKKPSAASRRQYGKSSPELRRLLVKLNPDQPIHIILTLRGLSFAQEAAFTNSLRKHKDMRAVRAALITRNAIFKAQDLERRQLETIAAYLGATVKRIEGSALLYLSCTVEQAAIFAKLEYVRKLALDPDYTPTAHWHTKNNHGPSLKAMLHGAETLH